MVLGWFSGIGGSVGAGVGAWPSAARGPDRSGGNLGGPSRGVAGGGVAAAVEKEAGWVAGYENQGLRLGSLLDGASRGRSNTRPPPAAR
jgi:hypothetical protein